MTDINYSMASSLVQANQALVREAERALENFHTNPDPVWTRHVEDWQEVVLANLRDYLRMAQAGISELDRGDGQTLANLAGIEVGLAKQMDGYSWAWAPAAQQERLQDLQTEVIRRAMAVHSHLQES